MTITDTYNYLMRIRRIEWTIKRLTLEHDELQTCLLPSAIRYDKDVVQTSPEDTLSAITSKVLELEARIRAMNELKADTITELGKAIGQLQNQMEGTVLTAYYIRRMTMEQVSEQIGKSLQHSYRLRKRGVAHLAQLI